MTTTVLNTKISDFENKIPDTSSLVTKTVLNIKIEEVQNKVPDHAKNEKQPPRGVAWKRCSENI